MMETKLTIISTSSKLKYSQAKPILQAKLISTKRLHTFQLTSTSWNHRHSFEWRLSPILNIRRDHLSSSYSSHWFRDRLVKRLCKITPPRGKNNYSHYSINCNIRADIWLRHTIRNYCLQRLRVQCTDSIRVYIDKLVLFGIISTKLKQPMTGIW